MLKRRFALILALLLASSALSCSGGEAPAESEAEGSVPAPAEAAEEEIAAEEEKAILDDGLEDTNMDGYEFRILSSYFNNRATANYLIYEEMTGEPLNDQLYMTKQTLEERFNIAFSIIEGGDDTGGATVYRTSVTGGDDNFDMHIGHDQKTLALANDGLAYNLYDVRQFDFEKPWWPERTLDALSIGDKMYAASNYASFCGLHWTRILTVNKGLAEEWKLEIPYSDVRDGTWTLDKFYALTNGISVDADGDGVLKEGADKFAIAGDGTAYYCIQEDMEIVPFHKDENNLPYLDIDMDRLDTYVTKMRALLAPDNFLVCSEEKFVNNTTLFMFSDFRHINDTYRNSDVEYGILPHPKFDENQENYICCCTDCPWIIPVTIPSDRIDNIGTVIEAMSAYNYNYTLPVYIENTLKGRIADAPDDAEMIQIIADNRAISFTYSFDLAFKNYIADLVLNTNNEPASYVEKNRKLADKGLERLVKTYMGE